MSSLVFTIGYYDKQIFIKNIFTKRFFYRQLLNRFMILLSERTIKFVTGARQAEKN